jgi:fructokinase
MEMRDVLAMYKNRLARSLAALINVLDPDVIVLGGGISNTETLYIGQPDLIARYAFSDGIRTKVVRAAHGDSSEPSRASSTPRRPSFPVANTKCRQ